MTSGCRSMYVTPWALYDSIAIPTGNNDRDHCNQVRLSPAHKNKTHAQASMGFELSLNFRLLRCGLSLLRRHDFPRVLRQFFRFWHQLHRF